MLAIMFLRHIRFVHTIRVGCSYRLYCYFKNFTEALRINILVFHILLRKHHIKSYIGMIFCMNVI